MTTTPPVRSPAYRGYTALLRQLHALIRFGQGDSPEADEIRDAMDGPGDRLDETEAELVGALSADLYTLGADPLRTSPEPTDVSTGEINRLFAERRWIEALAWARSDACTFPPAEAASLRATLWNNEFRDVDSAIIFAEEAVRLAPDQWKYTLELAKLFVFSDAIINASRLVVNYGTRNPGSVPEEILRLAKTSVASHQRWLDARKALRAAEEAARVSTRRAQESKAALNTAIFDSDHDSLKRMLKKARINLRDSKAAMKMWVPAAAL